MQVDRDLNRPYEPEPDRVAAPMARNVLLVPMLIFGIVMFGVGLIFLQRQAVESVYYGWLSAGWPIVTGRIVSAGAAFSGGRNGAHLAVNYRYEVAGRQYTGTRLRFGTGVGLGDRKSGDAFAQAQYPTGGPIKVYYYQDDPAIAVLEPGLHAGVTWWLDALLAPFVILALLLGACSMLWKIFKPKMPLETSTPARSQS